MCDVISIAIILFSLLGMICFKSSVVLCLISFIVAAAALVLPRLFRNKLKIASTVISLAGSAAAIIILLFSVTGVGEVSIYDYGEELLRIEKMSEKEPQKALEALDELYEEYDFKGKREALLRTGIYIRQNDTEGAWNSLYDFDYYCEDYFILRSKIIQMNYDRDGEDDVEGLNRDMHYLYSQAVDKLPYWDEGQARMGAYEYELNQNLTAARYYLASALSFNSANIIANYYMGVISFDQGYYEMASDFFIKAIDAGASDALIKNIAVYTYMMGGNKK